MLTRLEFQVVLFIQWNRGLYERLQQLWEINKLFFFSYLHLWNWSQLNSNSVSSLQPSCSMSGTGEAEG